MTKRGVTVLSWVSHLVIAPPLIVTEEQLDEACAALDAALEIADAKIAKATRLSRGGLGRPHPPTPGVEILPRFARAAAWLAFRAMTTPTNALPQSMPSQDDRVLAACAHLSFLAGFWLIAPIAIYVAKRKESHFVAFTALQAVVVQLLLRRRRGAAQRDLLHPVRRRRRTGMERGRHEVVGVLARLRPHPRHARRARSRCSSSTPTPPTRRGAASRSPSPSPARSPGPSRTPTRGPSGPVRRRRRRWRRADHDGGSAPNPRAQG